ncbi:MAG: DDE-type integrase/transposase/recombinase [Deltaproteobacteria bacterium]|nr:DDE-type integrase/transposase/recombinase [Deltaproteobacteria bacterium]
MPWQVRGRVELRLEFVRRALSGEGISRLCREFGVSRPTGYLWLRRFQESGRVISLRDRSHRPHYSPNKIEHKKERLVCDLRRKFGWGGRKIAVLLGHRGVAVTVTTANRIIKRNGLLVIEDRHKPALQRFARENPNELWQMDFKGPMGRGAAKCEPLTMLDDCSRYALEASPVKTKQTAEVQVALARIFSKYGLPDAILMDHGVPWYNMSNQHGLTKLAVWLMKQDIKLLFSGISHPQTQGKLERFHRTLAHAVRHKGTPRKFQEWRKILPRILYTYNHIRPHESLRMRTPAEFYKPSARAYRTKPHAVEYAAGSAVAKVDSHGMICFRGQRLFVCQALVGEYVKLDEIDGCLAASYRKTLIREINLRSGESFAL